MSADRQRQAALRWGLVGLGVQALVVARLLISFLQDFTDLSLRTDARVLSSRMSQLKPLWWKWYALRFYAGALLLLVALSLVALVALGLREAWRGEPDPHDDAGEDEDG